MPNTDLRECVEWDKETRVLRYHFAQPLMANGTPIGHTTCWVPWRPYHDATNGNDGFGWHDRYVRITHYQYTIVYCNGCGVDAAGYFHDQRTSRIRQRQRAANQEQRDRQRAQEIVTARYTYPDCGSRSDMEGACDDCMRIRCGDCREGYRPSDLNENGLCSPCQEARDESQEPEREER